MLPSPRRQRKTQNSVPESGGIAVARETLARLGNKRRHHHLGNCRTPAVDESLCVGDKEEGWHTISC